MRASFRSFCSSLSASRIQSFCEIIGHSMPNLNFAKPRRSTSEISDVLLRVKATIITNFWMVSRDTRLLGLRRGRFSSRSQLFSGVSVSAQNEAYDIRIVRVDYYYSWMQLVAPNLYLYRYKTLLIFFADFIHTPRCFPRGNVSYPGQRFSKMTRQFVTRGFYFYGVYKAT